MKVETVNDTRIRKFDDYIMTASRVSSIKFQLEKSREENQVKRYHLMRGVQSQIAVKQEKAF